jgi:hypothetical protein
VSAFTDKSDSIDHAMRLDPHCIGEFNLTANCRKRTNETVSTDFCAGTDDRRWMDVCRLYGSGHQEFSIFDLGFTNLQRFEVIVELQTNPKSKS